MTVTVLPLEYAHPQALGIPEARRAFRQLLILSVLSGLCIASCFLTFTETLIAAAIHALIFSATCILAVASGRSIFKWVSSAEDPSRTGRTVLDLLALAGVAIIGAAPVMYQLGQRLSITAGNPFAAALGLAFLLMALTSARHVMLYRLLARACRGINRRRMAGGLVALGWVKAVFEFLWLGCCGSALLLVAGRDVLIRQASDSTLFFAFAALIGVAGYAILWIWMIVAHSQLVRLAR